MSTRKQKPEFILLCLFEKWVMQSFATEEKNNTLKSAIREYLKLTEMWQHEPKEARLRERIVELIQ